MSGQASMKPIILALFVGLFAASLGATAAQISQSDLPDCALVLSGEIGPGDFEAFMREAQIAGLVDGERSGEARNSSVDALCLDSPGGLYHEGRRIAEQVHALGITSRVKADAHCYSACANIFMAGRSWGDEVDGPSRILHVGGRLGFHAPFYRIQSDRELPAEAVESMITDTSLLISDFIRFGSYSSVFDSRPMFSLSLLQEMLARGPGEVAFVDTVQDLDRWGISLAGHREAVQMTDDQRVQACVNFLAWTLDRPSERAHHLLTVSERVRFDSFWPDPVTFALIETGGYADQYCQIEITTGPASGVLVCSWDGFNGLLHGDCKEGMAHWIPWYWGMPPNTRLQSLPLQ